MIPLAWSRRLRWILGGGLLAAHTALVMWNFPLEPVLRGHPLCSVELSFHLAGAVEGRDFLAGRHRLWGYSPRFMAGYPFGLWNSIGTRGYESAPAFFPFVSTGVAFHLWILLTAWGPPLLVALAAHLIAPHSRESLLGVLAITLAFYHLGNLNTHFWTTGMIAFVTASALAVLWTTLVWKTVTHPEWRWPLTAALTAVAIVWINTLAVVPAAFGAICVLLAEQRHLRSVLPWVRLGIVACLATLALTPWVWALWEHRDLRGYMDLARIPSGWRYAVMDFLSDRRYRFPFDRRAAFHLMLAATVVAMIRDRSSPRMAQVFGASAFLLLGAAYLFPYSRFLDQTEPYRYLASAELMAMIPCTSGMSRLVNACRRASPDSRPLLVALGLVLAPALLGYGWDWLYRLQRPAGPLDPARLAVIEALRGLGPIEGRVLCEDKRLGNVLPYYLDVQVIGGTIGDESVLPHAWTGCGEKGVFGPRYRPERARRGQLGEDLRLYNVAVAISRSGDFKRDLLGTGHFDRDPSVGPYTLLLAPPQRLGFVEGQEGPGGPRVEAMADRLLIRDAPAGHFVLKYHFWKRLRGPEGVGLAPIWRGDDPVPFIEVDNSQGLRSIEITHGPPF